MDKRRVVYQKHRTQTLTPRCSLQPTNSDCQQFRIDVVDEPALVSARPLHIIIGEGIAFSVSIHCVDDLLAVSKA